MTVVQKTVVVVGEERDSFGLISSIAASRGFQIKFANDLAAVLSSSLVEPESPILLLLNVRNGSHSSALGLIAEIKKYWPRLGVIALGFATDVLQIMQAINYGAVSFLLKPLTTKLLDDVLITAADRYNIAAKLVGESRSFKSSLERALVLAKTRLNVAVVGESGSGCSSFARLISDYGELTANQSSRTVVANLSTTPPSLISKRLFESLRSSSQSYPGWIKAAEFGTLILDGVESLPPDAQELLADFLSSGAHTNTDGTLVHASDVRIVSVLSPKIVSMVENGQFSKTLYSDLAPQLVNLPPLRERPGDVQLLAEHFFRLNRANDLRPPKLFSESAARALSRYEYPTNVRELEQIINGAVFVSNGAAIEPHHLPDHVTKTGLFSRNILEDVRYLTIMRVVAECHGNQTEAAKRLGLARGTLNRILRGLDRQHSL